MAWLEAQSSEWVRSGLIEESTRARILGAYEIESSERRSMLALLLLGTLMFGIGVLLLIGYNWNRIPSNIKIAIIMSSVGASFAASAMAHARRHPVVGETLGLLGALLFGNAIWLIAQVLHIQGNFHDAFLWWAIGTLAGSALMQSVWTGTGGAILVGVWVLAASWDNDRVIAPFLLLWPLTLLLAYVLRSPLMLRVTAFAAAPWMMWSGATVLEPFIAALGSIALLGCAFCAVAAWHDESSPMRRAWHSTGLTVLLVALVPLLSSHLSLNAETGSVTFRALMVLLVPFAVAMSIWLRPLRLAEVSVGATAMLIAVWLALMPGKEAWVGVTALFNVAALAIAVSLIRMAVRTDRPADLAFGVLFGLGFLIVRWIDLIDNMLWSGLILIAASVGLFAVARAWRYRVRPVARSGAAS
jgi:hypothetical protein